MKLSRIKRSLCIKTINCLFCGTHFFRVKAFLLKCGGITCGVNTKIVGPLYVGNVAHLSLGSNVWIGTNFSVYGNGKVIIDDNVDVAPEVSILTGSHEISHEKGHRAGEGIQYRVCIKEGCWVGARATIMGNTEVGKGSVIGAAALVNTSVAPNTLCAGVPAKALRTI